MEYLNWIDAKQDELLDFLSGLISFESVTKLTSDPRAPHGKAVADCLEFALQKARSFGFDTTNFHGHAGLIDFEKAKKVPELGILCHLDVVPAGEGWDSPPFCASVRNGVLYGRGATDDKGPFASALFALAAIKSAGIKLSKNVRLICGTCEETGSEDMEFCLSHGVIPETVFSPDADYPVVNTEKGMVRFCIGAAVKNSVVKAFSGGEVINMVAPAASARVERLNTDLVRAAFDKLSDKGLHLEIDGDTVTVRGTPAHASTPDMGANAISALCTVLAHALPENDPALHPLCKQISLFSHGESNGAGFGVRAADELSGELTMNLGLCELSDGVLKFSYDVRYPLCVNGRDLQKKIENALAEMPFSLISFSDTPPHHVPEDTELVKALLSAYERFTGNPGKCLAIGGGTYVHHMPGGVAFGPVYPGEDNRIHCANEFVKVEHLIQNAKIIASAILDLAR